LITIEY